MHLHQLLVSLMILKTITLPGIVYKILFGGPKHYVLRNGAARCLWSFPLPDFVSATQWFVPHMIITATLDGGNVFRTPPLICYFCSPGVSSGGATQVLPFNWIIEWDRFVDRGSSFPDHFARKIDTRRAAT